MELASASARALNYTVGSDGLITLRIVRAPDGTKRQVMGTLITSACGASAYTNNVGVSVTIANVCGVYSPSEPNKNNDDLTSPVVVRIPLSQFYTILKSTKVLTVAPG